MYNVVNHKKFIHELPQKHRPKASKLREMTYEQAASITNSMLDALQTIFEVFPIKAPYCSQIGRVELRFPRVSTFIHNGCTETITIEIQPECFRVEDLCSRADDDEYHLSPIYKVMDNGRIFEITLFDDPADCGYCSILPDYDPETYVLCNIVEKRSTGETKYEMVFGVDIEKRTFMELFELIHFNTSGIMRLYSDSDQRLETELKDTVIFLS